MTNNNVYNDIILYTIQLYKIWMPSKTSKWRLKVSKGVLLDDWFAREDFKTFRLVKRMQPDLIIASVETLEPWHSLNLWLTNFWKYKYENKTLWEFPLFEWINVGVVWTIIECKQASNLNKHTIPPFVNIHNWIVARPCQNFVNKTKSL